MTFSWPVGTTKSRKRKLLLEFIWCHYLRLNWPNFTYSPWSFTHLSHCYEDLLLLIFHVKKLWPPCTLYLGPPFQRKWQPPSTAKSAADMYIKTWTSSSSLLKYLSFDVLFLINLFRHLKYEIQTLEQCNASKEEPKHSAFSWSFAHVMAEFAFTVTYGYFKVMIILKFSPNERLHTCPKMF